MSLAIIVGISNAVLILIPFLLTVATSVGAIFNTFLMYQKKIVLVRHDLPTPAPHHDFGKVLKIVCGVSLVFSPKTSS